MHGLGVMLGPGSIAATGPPRRGASYRGHSVPPTNWLVERALLERIGPWREPGAIGRPVDVDVLDRIAATGPRIACAPRLTTVKFPSPLWRAYAPDAPRPQIAMSQELARDAGTLAARLLCDVAAEHARATFPTWAPPPALLWRDVAQRVKTALGATLRQAEHVPILGTLLAGGTSASAAASGSSAASIRAERSTPLVPSAPAEPARPSATRPGSERCRRRHGRAPPSAARARCRDSRRRSPAAGPPPARRAPAAG